MVRDNFYRLVGIFMERELTADVLRCVWNDADIFCAVERLEPQARRTRNFNLCGGYLCICIFLRALSQMDSRRRGLCQRRARKIFYSDSLDDFRCAVDFAAHASQKFNRACGGRLQRRHDVACKFFRVLLNKFFAKCIT